MWQWSQSVLFYPGVCTNDLGLCAPGVCKNDLRMIIVLIPGTWRSESSPSLQYTTEMTNRKDWQCYLCICVFRVVVCMCSRSVDWYNRGNTKTKISIDLFLEKYKTNNSSERAIQKWYSLPGKKKHICIFLWNSMKYFS